MADNFTKCIKGRKDLSPEQADRLIRKYENKVNEFKKKGTPLSSARLAAEELINEETRTAQMKTLKLQRQAVAEETALTRLKNTKIGDPAYNADTMYKQAEIRGRQIYETGVAAFPDEASKIIEANQKDVEFQKSVIKDLRGEKIADSEVSIVSKNLRNLMDYFHSKIAATGADIGYLKNYTPQSYEAKRVSAVSSDEFVNKAVKRHNWAEMESKETGMKFQSEDEYRPVAAQMYKDITSGEGKGVAQANISGRYEQSRFIEYNTVDDFLADNDDFGSGNENLLAGIQNYMLGAARDAGVMEVLGPMPTSTKVKIDDYLKEAGVGANRRQFTRSVFDQLTYNFAQGSPDSVLQKSLSIGLNWERTVLLPNAGISAMSDVGWGMFAAKSKGLPIVQYAANWIDEVFSGKNSLTKQQLKMHAVIGDGALRDLRSDIRFMVNDLQSSKATRAKGTLEKVEKFSSKAANFVNKISGLGHLTDSGYNSGVRTLLGEVGSHISTKTKWDNLNVSFRNNLESLGATKEDWNFLVNNAHTVDIGGAQVFAPNSLRIAGFKGADGITAKKIADIIDDAARLQGIIATNEPDVATRAITSGGFLGDKMGGKGTTSKMLSSAFFLFKSFPVSSFQKHMVPLLKPGITPAEKVGRLSQLMIVGTLMGTTVMQIKQLLAGKTPRPWDDYRTYMAGFMQFGGAGFFGDFFIESESRFGRNKYLEALGPLGGSVGDVLAVATEAAKASGIAAKEALGLPLTDKDKSNFNKAFFNLVKRHTPRVPIANTAAERWTFDQLEEMIVPGTVKRRAEQEKHMRQNSGQDMLWKKGETLPEFLK